MAKLTRVTGKVFGATANSSGNNPEIGQFGSAKEGSYNGTGDVATIQSLPAWSNGWIDAVTPTQQYPALPEMTGVHKVLSYQNAYLLQQGIPEWDSSTDYYTNGFCSKNGKIYYSLTDNNTNHDPESDTVNWAEFTSGSSRNIGEIVQSTIPLTDAGLHLLDGSLLQYGSYKAFVDYIADLYDSGDYDDIFETEANWQSAVTTYGVCGKFVYDSVNNTVRLPKYNSKIYTGGGTAPVKGNGTALGLTNGSNNGALTNTNLSAQYDQSVLLFNRYMYNTSVGTTVGQKDTALSEKAFGVTTDGTKSGIIADLANITTSVDGYYYIVIATSTKTDIQVDIDEIATDLNGKADVDLSNAVPSSSFASVLLTSGIGTVISSFHSGDDFYIVFAGGFCIQGGRYGAGTGNTSGSVTYLKVFAQNDYCLQGNLLQAVNAAAYDNEKPNTPTTTGFSFSYNNGRTYSWFAMGQLAEGEY